MIIHYLFLLIAFLAIRATNGSNLAPQQQQQQQNVTVRMPTIEQDLSTIQLKLVSKSPINANETSTKWICKSSNRRKKVCHYVSTYTPVVMWHGMGDTAFGSINADRKALEQHFKGMQVFSIQIGNNPIEDELGGYFVNVNRQIEQACEAILSNELIKSHGSFNAIGFSQGGQFMRGLIERCPFNVHGIKVKNFISLGGQHQGVYGLPNCPDKTFCDYIRYALTTAAYEKTVQEHIVQAEYWHDPLKENDYKNYNIFLSDINNEIKLNETYRRNLIQLDNLVLVEFLQDDMVIPPESSVFGFFKTGQTSLIEHMESSRLYLEDRIGLKVLNDNNRLHLVRVPGRHLQYSMSWFLEQIASVYLDN